MKKNSKLYEIIKYLKKDKDYFYKSEILEYLEKDIYDFDEDLLYEILKIIIKNNMKFTIALAESKDLYNMVVYNKNDIIYFLKALSYTKDLMTSKLSILGHIYQLFENKKLAIYLYKYIYEEVKESDLSYLIQYIKEARKYYIDETAFYSSVISFHSLLLTLEEKSDAKDKKIKNIKMQIGIYSYEKDKLEKITKEENEIQKKAEDLESMIKQIKEKTALIDEEEVVKETFEVKKLYKKVKKIELRNKYALEKELLSKLDFLINKTKNNDISENTTFKEDQSLYTFIGNLKQELNLESNYEKDIYFMNLIKQTFKNLPEKIEFNSMTNFILKFYYYALYNDTLKIFIESLKRYPYYPPNHLELCFFSKENASLFEEEEYISYIVTKDSMLLEFIKNDNITLFRDLIKENKDFENFITQEELEKAVKIFGVKEIANANDTLKSFLSYYSKGRFDEIHEELKKHPDFTLAAPINDLTYAFTIKEIVLLDRETQIKAEEILSAQSIYKIMRMDKNDVKKLVFKDN